MKLKYLILFIVIINCTSKSSQSNSYQYKIVCPNDGINIRTGPGIDYSKDSSGQLFKGENIYVLEEKDGWLHFRVTPGDVGWSGWVLKRLVVTNNSNSRNTTNADKSEQRDAKTQAPLLIDVINSKSYGSTMTGVKIKITNTSGKDINRAEVTCIAKNNSGETIDFMKHYVIKSLDGGLARGDFTYFEYILNVNRNLVNTVHFKLESISYR